MGEVGLCRRRVLPQLSPLESPELTRSPSYPYKAGNAGPPGLLEAPSEGPWTSQSPLLRAECLQDNVPESSADISLHVGLQGLLSKKAGAGSVPRASCASRQHPFPWKARLHLLVWILSLARPCEAGLWKRPMPGEKQLLRWGPSPTQEAP